MEESKEEIKTNRDFWINKIENNISRDVKVNKELSSEGWTILRFWTKEIKNSTNPL